MMLVGMTVALGAEVGKVPTILPLGTSEVMVIVTDDSIWFKAGRNGASSRTAWMISSVTVEALFNEQNLLHTALSAVPPMALSG